MINKYESSSHINVLVLVQPVIEDISPKASPGVNVLNFFNIYILLCYYGI